MKTTQCTRFQFHHVEPLCLINKTCTWPTVAKVLVEPAISSYFHSLHAITVTIIFISYMLLSLVLFSFHTCYYRRQYHTVCNISLRQIWHGQTAPPNMTVVDDFKLACVVHVAASQWWLSGGLAVGWHGAWCSPDMFCFAYLALYVDRVHPNCMIFFWIERIDEL